MAEPVRIAIVADADQATTEMRQVIQAAQDTEERLDAAGRAAGGWSDKIDFAGGAAEKFAGGIGDIAGGLAANGLISEEAAAKAEQYAQGLTVITGAADIATTSAALYAAAQNAGGIASARAAIAAKAHAVGTAIQSGATKAAAAAQWLFNAALLANPIGLIILAIVALVAIFVLLWKNSETFRNIVIGAWEAIKTAGLAVFNFLKAFFVTMFNFYMTVFETAWNAIKAVTSFVFDAIKAYIAFVLGVIKGAFDIFMGGVRAVWSGMQWLWDKAVAIFTGVKNAIGAALDWIRSKIQAAVDGALAIWARITGLVDKVTELRDRIIATISGMVDRFLGFGKDIMRGLADGIAAGIQWVKDKVSGLGDMIPDWLKSVLGISSPSKVMAGLGKNVIQGLNRGLESQVPELEKTLSSVSGTIAGLSAEPTIAISADASLSSLSAARVGSAAADSGSTYNITVNIAAGGDPAEAGRQVVKTIEAYERRTGRRRLVPAT